MNRKETTKLLGDLLVRDTWRDIPGYRGKYQADREGNVRRIFPSGKTREMHPYGKKKHRCLQTVVKLTIDGKPKEEILMQVIARTFLGPCPPGCVLYHRNGCQADNYVNNLEYITRRELGRRTGAKSNRMPVAKIDNTGEIVEVYTSAREAGRKNYLNYQTVIDRCNGKCKSAFAPDGFAYAWEDKEASMRDTIRKIELENGYMPKAQDVVFEW